MNNTNFALLHLTQATHNREGDTVIATKKNGHCARGKQFFCLLCDFIKCFLRIAGLAAKISAIRHFQIIPDIDISKLRQIAGISCRGIADGLGHELCSCISVPSYPAFPRNAHKNSILSSIACGVFINFLLEHCRRIAIDEFFHRFVPSFYSVIVKTTVLL